MQQKAYALLDGLLKQGQLRGWVEASKDFKCVREGNQMLIRGATAPAASGAILALENAPPALTADTATAAAPAAPAPAPAPADGAVPGGQQRERGPGSTEVPHMVRREDHWWLDAHGRWWIQDAEGKWWAEDDRGNWRFTIVVSDGWDGAWPADDGNGASPWDQNLVGNAPDQPATGAARASALALALAAPAPALAPSLPPAPAPAPLPVRADAAVPGRHEVRRRPRGGWQHRGRDASREEWNLHGRWCQDENGLWCWKDARGTWWLRDGRGNWRSTSTVLDTRTGAWRWN